MKAVKFLVKNWGDGQAVSGWTVDSILVFNGQQYKLSEGCGDFRGRVSCELVGPYDGGMKDGREVDVDELQVSVQRVLGVKTRVPAGKVLVTTHQGRDMDWFDTFDGGSEVEPTKLRRGQLLSPGEKVDVPDDVARDGRYVRLWFEVTNVDGKAVMYNKTDNLPPR